jgi:hypothetical protein
MLIIRCSLRELKPQISGILFIIEQEFEAVGCETVVLTSGWREFGEGSFHPLGYAVDADSPQMPEDINDHKWGSLKVRLVERLGDEYDVLVHGPKAHAHIEWDPRHRYAQSVKV